MNETPSSVVTSGISTVHHLNVELAYGLFHDYYGPEVGGIIIVMNVSVRLSVRPSARHGNDLLMGAIFVVASLYLYMMPIK